VDHKLYVMDHIKELTQLLDFKYGSPVRNIRKDPLDELVHIMLIGKERSVEDEMIFAILKKKYSNWEDFIENPLEKILLNVNSSTLTKRKINLIKENLNLIYKQFGQYSLSKLKKWRNLKVFKFLKSLKEIDDESAYCIMLYAFQREVFPVNTNINRTCQRLGLINAEIVCKEGQELLKDIFPGKLRYSLHVNMTEHGKKICHSRNPFCDKCAIAGFCKRIRSISKTRGKYGFADLFSGAGGMSLGFEKAGYNLQVSIDANPRACATFLHNRTSLDAEKVINGNIEKINPANYAGKGIKVIVAGPPCQEFSPVRKNGFGETGRNELYKQVLYFVKAIEPVFVVIENVPGMVTHLKRKYVNKVEEGLRKLGYAVHSEMINAKHYGIPQNRLRLFFIARRIYGHSREIAENSINRVWEHIHLKKQVGMIGFLQGTSGLPELSPGEGEDLLRSERKEKLSDYAHKMLYDGELIFNHIARKHNPRDLEAYTIMDEGENALDLYRKRPDLMPYSTKNFQTKFFKIRSGDPSPTIVAHLRRDANSFIHPRDNRGITPREAARLQSFPDNYRFLGSFGLQFEQIGNAVPPLLAEVIGNALIEELDSSGKGKNYGQI